MRIFLWGVPLMLSLAGAAPPAQAAGCISGAIAGGIAGHYAGHHAVLGAVGGCIAGHELKKRQTAAKALNDKKYDDEIVHAEPPPIPPAPTPTQAH